MSVTPLQSLRSSVWIFAHPASGELSVQHVEIRTPRQRSDVRRAVAVPEVQRVETRTPRQRSDVLHAVAALEVQRLEIHTRP